METTMRTVILDVPDISCEHCERTVLQALGRVDGVTHVEVDVPSKRVTIAHDRSRVSIDDLQRVLAAEDYPVASTTES
jgi:copper chaperone CopZ